MRRIILLGFVISILGAITVFSTPINEANVSAQSNNISVEAVEGSSVAEKLEERVEQSWPWYLTRAAGLVAAISLIILIISGIGMINGQTFRFLEPITAWASHRALGIVFGISVFLHVIALYFDSFVPFSFADLLIPFVSDFKRIEIFNFNVGSLYVAMGVLALYLTAAIIFTSLVWINKKPKIWKITHILSYIVMLFVFLHALYLGTDLASGPLRWAWITVGVLVLFASLIRLRRAYTV
jgi:predicted ferric reductase